MQICGGKEFQAKRTANAKTQKLFGEQQGGQCGRNRVRGTVVGLEVRQVTRVTDHEEPCGSL